jgi:3-deoxy-D-manno-octulosonic-acid transferase
VSWLLDLGYLLLSLVVAPWLVWSAWRQGKYREGWSAKLWGQVPERVGDRRCIWFHAVSVGEVNLLSSLLPQLPSDVDCVVTATTRTGYQLARRKYAQHLVSYCPLDFSWAVRRTLRRFRPDLLVLVELELWPNLIRSADRLGVPVVIVNGRLGDASYRGYRRIRWLIAPVLRRLAWIGAQTETYARRFTALGAVKQRVSVTGSMKFDGAETNRDNARTRRLAERVGITPHDLVFLAGSTQEPEERLVLETFQQLAPQCPQLRLILVPRHPERFEEVADLLQRANVSWQRRSQPETSADAGARVLLVDTVGELGAWWGVAQIAFVGGSLGDRGGQNMIEPAAYGAAVSFGPNTWNFRDIVQRLCQAKAAEVVQDGPGLTRFVQRCLAQPGYRHQLGDNARRLVLDNQGAATRTCEQIMQLLPSIRSGGSVSNPRASSTRVDARPRKSA